jgi:H+-translocating NAD(P) transhydrogenase subunit alpha
MNVGTLINDLTIFALAILLGFEVISRVPATLHTPLMSGTNSIHGIVLVGAIALGASADNPLTGILAFLAVVFAAANVVGGYWVTDRMLQMFKRRPVPKAGTAAPRDPSAN